MASFCQYFDYCVVYPPFELIPRRGEFNGRVSCSEEGNYTVSAWECTCARWALFYGIDCCLKKVFEMGRDATSECFGEKRVGLAWRGVFSEG